MKDEYSRHAKATLDSFELKKLEKLKIEEPQETIAILVKLKRQKTGTGIKILTPNKLSIRLPLLSSQTKAGNNSHKLKNEIRQIVYLVYQYNKITKKLYNNLIKSL